MSTPSERLLRRLRQQTGVTGFRVSLTDRQAALLLGSEERRMPDPATTIAFFSSLTGDAIDRVEVYAGAQLALVHQLVDGKRRWRSTTSADSEAEAA